MRENSEMELAQERSITKDLSNKKNVRERTSSGAYETLNKLYHTLNRQIRKDQVATTQLEDQLDPEDFQSALKLSLEEVHN